MRFNFQRLNSCAFYFLLQIQNSKKRASSVRALLRLCEIYVRVRKYDDAEHNLESCFPLFFFGPPFRSLSLGCLASVVVGTKAERREEKSLFSLCVISLSHPHEKKNKKKKKTQKDVKKSRRERKKREEKRREREENALENRAQTKKKPLRT